jgi:hypothetical protein
MPDDQYFAYLKTKYDSEQDPTARVKLMSDYLKVFPKGNHTGEATALWEKAQKEETQKYEELRKGTVIVDCHVTLGSGQTVPVQGFIQLFKCPDGLDQIMKKVLSNPDVRNNAEGARLGRQTGVDMMDLYLMAFGRAYRDNIERQGKLVAQGNLSEGRVTFADLPAGYVYIVYGSGVAGLNVIGYWGGVVPQGGRTVSANQESISAFCKDGDASRFMWHPIE